MDDAATIHPRHRIKLADGLDAVNRMRLSNQGKDARVVVLQKPLEGLSTFARDDPLPSHAAFKIAQSLPVG